MKFQSLENDLSLNSFLKNFPTLLSIHLFAKEMHENKQIKGTDLTLAIPYTLQAD